MLKWPLTTKSPPAGTPEKRGFPIGQSNRDTVNGKLTARRRHFDPSWDINGRTLFSRHFYPSGSLLLLALNRWRPAAQKETDPSPSRHRDDPDYFAGPSFFFALWENNRKKTTMMGVEKP